MRKRFIGDTGQTDGRTDGLFSVATIIIRALEEELEKVGASRVSLSLAQWPRSGTVVV